MTDLAFPAFIGIVTLVFAAFLVKWILSRPTGNKKMVEIAAAIQEGAGAYLSKQYTTLLPFVVILALVIWFFVGMELAVSFLAGVIASALAGYIGMMISVRANVRTAQAADMGL